jgi:DNA-binding beta-propeller fold protein YncE
MTARPLRRLLVPALLAALAAGAAPAHGADGIITTIAGSTPGLFGDGGPAVAAGLDGPEGVTTLPDGSLLIADTANSRIRRVAPDGTITTALGEDGPGLSGDGGPAELAQVDHPADVAAMPDGGYLIADAGNDRVRRVAPDGTVSTVAGTIRGLAGDGGPATAARLDAPVELAPTADGGFLVADSGNARIRRVAADGTITTVAGTSAGLAGDGGPATAARLDRPAGVALTPDGGFLIADAGNGRIRRVAPDGTITTVAGAGTGSAGDGGRAVAALLDDPSDVIPLSHGGFLLADRGNDRLRRVTPLGTIFTIAGGAPGLAGDGGPASAALLRSPTSLLPAPGGGVLVGDSGNARIRRLSDVGAIPPPQLLRSVGVQPARGTVTVRPGGSGPAIPLQEQDLAPTTSSVDATRGAIDLTVRRRDGVRLATAEVSQGSFRMSQSPRGPAVATLTLTGPITGCARPRAGAASADGRTRKRTARPRRVHIRVKGPYRTNGRYASAIASGTAWTIVDGCRSTVIHVTEGRVKVTDRRTHRVHVIRAGRTYTALATPPRRRP